MSNDIPQGPGVWLPRAQYDALMAAAKDSVIAWAVCASIHREYAKRKDGLYTTRQTDFIRHENTARAALRAAGVEMGEETCL